MADDMTRQDGIQHGIDDDPANDAEKGAALGGVGGAVVGAVAGAMTGPVGAVIGAVAGGLAGAGASGAAVGAVDRVDNDNNVTGVGDNVATDDDVAAPSYNSGDAISYGTTGSGTLGSGIGNDLPGIQTGGTTLDGSPDTRGVMEKTADALTGDRVDDKTGRVV